MWQKGFLTVTIVLIVLMMAACGADHNKTTEKIFYSDLTEEIKSEIDFLLDNIKETTTDSGSVFSCRCIKFGSDNNNNKVIVIYYSTYGSNVLIYEQYKFSDKSKTYEKLERGAIGNAQINGSISPLYPQDWSSSWSLESKRNNLANKYWTVYVDQ